MFFVEVKEGGIEGERDNSWEAGDEFIPEGEGLGLGDFLEHDFPALPPGPLKGEIFAHYWF